MTGRDDLWSQMAQPEHKAAARILGYALTLWNDFGCRAAAFFIRHSLGPEDRMILATAVMEGLTNPELASVLGLFERMAA